MQSISVFELIKVGLGPSSSHTMGPWTASLLFLSHIDKHRPLSSVKRISVALYGSLALTGKGHGTDVAVMLGLKGYHFAEIDPNRIDYNLSVIQNEKTIKHRDGYIFNFDPSKDIVFHKSERLPYHANGMEYFAEFEDGELLTERYYSIGGGFVSTESQNTIEVNAIKTPYPCHKAEDINHYCQKLEVNLAELVYLNEVAWQPLEEVKKQCLYIWTEIKDCIYRGIHKEGILPGSLKVKRRAAELNIKLLDGCVYNNFEEWVACIKQSAHTFKQINKWISAFALAVNEENASFGRIITAPTNGAAGVIPAVLMYAYIFEDITEEQICRFIVSAGEIGTLFKKNATISAAMGGCQAEIGVSSAMAAAGLTDCLGGSYDQALMAAEIAMEHHLGLTCDPIAGLVQVPCIERNSMGAIKAITASNLAIDSDPKAAKVSLDDVIKAMWETAQDMHSKYKETSEGGLAANIAVHIVEC